MTQPFDPWRGASESGLGGTLYVLVMLVEKKSIGPEDAIGHLDRLIDLGWYCSASLYRSARALLEERFRT